MYHLFWIGKKREPQDGRLANHCDQRGRNYLYRTTVVWSVIPRIFAYKKPNTMTLLLLLYIFFA